MGADDECAAAPYVVDEPSVSGAVPGIEAPEGGGKPVVFTAGRERTRCGYCPMVSGARDGALGAALDARLASDTERALSWESEGVYTQASCP